MECVLLIKKFVFDEEKGNRSSSSRKSYSSMSHLLVRRRNPGFLLQLLQFPFVLDKGEHKTEKDLPLTRSVLFPTFVVAFLRRRRDRSTLLLPGSVNSTSTRRVVVSNTRPTRVVGSLATEKSHLLIQESP